MEAKNTAGSRDFTRKIPPLSLDKRKAKTELSQKFEIRHGYYALFGWKEAQNMLYVFNFNLKEYKLTEYQKFIQENEKTMVEHAPKGWKYKGTYFYVLGFGPYTAAQFWEISDYADLDTFRNHDDPIWLELGKRSMEFGTPEPTPSWLLREAGDTKITEPKKKP